MSENEKSYYKGVLIFISVVIFVAFIMLLYTMCIYYLDSRVYEPIGTITEEEANNAKWGTMIGFPYILIAFLARFLILLFAILTLLFWYHPKKRFWFILIIIIIIEITLFDKLERHKSHKAFIKAFTNVTIKAKDLINAIEKYKEENGIYPDKLEVLVPKFISEIPNTGLAGYPRFEYKKADKETIFKHYELLVNTLQGFNIDVFVYWPERNYPDNFYGGVPEKIEDWAYVHE